MAFERVGLAGVVLMGIAGFASVGGCPTSAQEPFSSISLAGPERAFEEAMISGDVNGALAAIEQMEGFENRQAKNWSIRGSSSKAYLKGEAGGVVEESPWRSGAMVESLLETLDEDQYFAAYNRLSSVTIDFAIGKTVQRLRPLPKGHRASFDIDVLTSGKVTLSIDSKYQNAAYTVEVLDAAGAAICRSDAPSTRFECSWNARKDGAYHLSVTSVGPLSSMLRVLII